jgi:hypothetical protein
MTDDDTDNNLETILRERMGLRRRTEPRKVDSPSVDETTREELERQQSQHIQDETEFIEMEDLENAIRDRLHLKRGRIVA